MQAQSTGLGSRLARYGDHFHGLAPVSPRDAFFRYVADRLALPGLGREEAERIRQHGVRTAKGDIVQKGEAGDKRIPIFYVFHGDMEHGKGAGPTRLVTDARYVLVSVTVITAENLNGHLFTLGTNLEKYTLIDDAFSDETRFERRKAVHIATLRLGENGEEVLLWADVIISNAKTDNGGSLRNLSVVLSGNFMIGRDLLDDQERFRAQKKEEDGQTRHVLNGTSGVGGSLREALLERINDLRTVSSTLLESLDTPRQELFLIVDNL